MMRQVLGTNYDQWMRDYTADLAATATLARSPQALVRKYVPVVVHIIHIDGTDNITDAEVYDAIRLLNQNYQSGGPDSTRVQQPIFRSRIRTANFEFRLAKLDPQGNCTSGITRHYSPLTDVAGENVKDLPGSRWNPSRYLNIWVVETIASGAGGYSFLPCPGTSNDGVVIRSEQFSSIGRSGGGGQFAARSLTHEVGHYFGLPHTWGGSNTPGVASNCSMDDGIADTPNEMGVSGFGCPITMASCPGASDPYANVENYMNYAACPRMFTAGQVAVMRNSLNTACRSTLVSAANLQTTGIADGLSLPPCPPTAYLWSPDAVGAPLLHVCEGATIDFHGEAYGRGAIPTGGTVTYQWTLPGAQTPTATGQNISVTYPTGGRFDVTLTVTDGNGSNTYTRAGYVIVGSGTVGLATPVVFGFDNNAFPIDSGNALRNWEITQNGTGLTWEFSPIGYQSSSGARVKLRNVSPGTIHDLISPAVIVTAPLLNQKLYFRRAYSARNSIDDKLLVNYSLDCGTSWGGRTLTRTSSQMNSSQNAASNWVPQASEWRLDSLLLPNLQAGTALRLRFRVIAGTSIGNALYLDDLRVGASPLGLFDALELPSESLSVYPNPSDGQARVRVQLASAATLTLYDATGRRIGASLPLSAAGAGAQEVELRRFSGEKLARGLYLVELRAADGARRIERVIVL